MGSGDIAGWKVVRGFGTGQDFFLPSEVDFERPLPVVDFLTGSASPSASSASSSASSAWVDFLAGRTSASSAWDFFLAG
jgi:hypothetical protein